ncbi:hypothetical protein [Dysgonomonas sp. 25]|uniref:hypothetical protein n=1 Tax=Dysgonomonas sp. 25 TaxID=2302933 RepID=UPI0013D29692|nr:hypothetical protein [Dysgonomonas sp. 25]NDV69412.1 hypothetical protein [Dysgonomonas sp. 25]
MKQKKEGNLWLGIFIGLFIFIMAIAKNIDLIQSGEHGILKFTLFTVIMAIVSISLSFMSYKLTRLFSKTK